VEVIAIFEFGKTNDEKQQSDSISQQKPDAKSNTKANDDGKNVSSKISEYEALLKKIFFNSRMVYRKRPIFDQ